VLYYGDIIASLSIQKRVTRITLTILEMSATSGF